MTTTDSSCELCESPGGVTIWQDADWRVVRVADADFPAFYRVIAQRHTGEFSDLGEPQRRRCMALVCAIERVLIVQLKPTKMNLAALGNMVPHLHWHVVARFDWDSRFPHPIWSPAQREVTGPGKRLAVPLDTLDAMVTAALDVADAG